MTALYVRDDAKMILSLLSATLSCAIRALHPSNCTNRDRAKPCAARSDSGGRASGHRYHIAKGALGGGAWFACKPVGHEMVSPAPTQSCSPCRPHRAYNKLGKRSPDRFPTLAASAAFPDKALLCCIRRTRPAQNDEASASFSSRRRGREEKFRCSAERYRRETVSTSHRAAAFS